MQLEKDTHHKVKRDLYDDFKKEKDKTEKKFKRFKSLASAELPRSSVFVPVSCLAYRSTLGGGSNRGSFRQGNSTGFSLLKNTMSLMNCSIKRLLYN